MILVFGGAYQGKVHLAQEQWKISPEETMACTVETTVFPTSRLVTGVDQFVLGMLQRGEDPERWFAEQASALQDRILVFQDVSQGVVPMDPVLRQWREANGRILNRLAAEADQVWRVFCGMGKQVKP